MPKDTKKKMVVVEEVVPEVEGGKSEVKEVNSKIEDVNVEESLSKTSVNIDETQDGVQNTNYLFIIVPIALLVGALVGGLITYFSGLSRIASVIGQSPAPSSIPSNVVEPTPSSSPASLLKKDDLKIQILNASGVSGVAGKVKVLLTEAGYKNIDTGNANISDLAQTEISIKESKKEYLDMVVKDLSKNYDAVESKKALSASSKYDLVITLGEK